jgi:acetyltransferase
MATRNLKHFFAPHRVAVIGASDDLTKVGGTVLRNLVLGGFRGVVYPVNARRESVQGIACYANVASLPHPPDLAVIATPASTVAGLVDELGTAGTRAVLVLSAGFREAGKEGQELEAAVRAAAARHDGLRIMGPNCLGLIVPGKCLNASFAAAMPRPGRVAFLSQSGALCTSVLDWALEANLGFSHFVSVGNMLDVDMADLIDYLAADPQTEALILYIESVTDAREFMSAARAFSRSKPIVAYKAGRFAESAQAAASHTGALAGVDAVYAAAFERAGIVRVFDVDEMFDCAELLARQRVPQAARLAIVTNAGGPGVMATDALMDRQGLLASLCPQTIAQLSTFLPAYWSHNNPVDILGDAPPARYAQALQTVAQDEGVDAVLVILTPQAMTDAAGTARAVVEAASKTSKPVLATWMGGPAVRAGVEILNRAGIPTYRTPEQAVRAFMYLVSYARNREILYETPRDVPVTFSVDRSQARRNLQTALAQGRTLLSEQDSKALLEAYGIPTTRPLEAYTAEEAIAHARSLGYPVVLKVLSPQITHKTDVGGVALDLCDDGQVREAFARIVDSARRHRPDAEVQGVTVQRMVATSRGFEMIVGAKRDPVFGAVLLVGMGGVAAEVFQDRALGLPPLNERLARRMLESLWSWPLLRGYRGQQAVHLDRLVEILLRFSYLVADCPEIQELDANPLVVTPEDAIALDARVILSPHDGRASQPFAHLAIRPYPEEFVRHARLKDGTEVLLRPIKPEDEPAWHRLLARCSQQSIWFRFRYLFKETTHKMAVRFCFIDYDRELAIVAESSGPAPRELWGVGRLVADPNHEQAEYAVLVADEWQGRGLGSLLTSYCTEIAARWQVRRLYAETTPDNTRMIRTFQRWGFELEHKPDLGVVLARKELTPPA